MTDLITIVAGALVGFIIGILVYNNNTKKTQQIIADAEALAEKAEAEAKELAKRLKKKPAKKKTVKRPQVD